MTPQFIEVTVPHDSANPDKAILCTIATRRIDAVGQNHADKSKGCYIVIDGGDEWIRESYEWTRDYLLGKVLS